MCDLESDSCNNPFTAKMTIATDAGKKTFLMRLVSSICAIICFLFALTPRSFHIISNGKALWAKWHCIT